MTTVRRASVTDSPETAEHGLTGRDRRQLLAARRHIDAHLADALRASEVARIAGLIETALRQGFRALFGTGVYA